MNFLEEALKGFPHNININRRNNLWKKLIDVLKKELNTKL